jgi:hypothetical protein
LLQNSSRVALASVALVAAFLVQAAAGSSLLKPPAGSPDPKNMVLRSSDLGGAKVSSQGYYKDTDLPSVISYRREFEEARLGAVVLLDVESEAGVGKSAASTLAYFSVLKRLSNTKAFRTALKKEFARGASQSGGLLSGFQVGKSRGLGVGDRSFDLPISFRVLGLRIDAHLAVFTVDRMLHQLVAVGVPGGHVSRATVARLAKIAVAHTGVELQPANTTPPAVSGTAQSGQTLTTTDGTWRNPPTSFTYQWQRCDAMGANCVDIPGATTSSYVLTDADVGSTVRSEVTATTRFGTASAFSLVTPVIAPAA